MPIYTYVCNNCEERFDQFHSMAEQLNDCHLCGTSNSLTKQMSQISSIKKESHGPRVGEIVKKHIEDAKRDIKEEQQKMMQEME